MNPYYNVPLRKMSNHIVTGADIGGTHITVCKVDLQNNKVLENTRYRCVIDAMQDADTIINTWSQAIRKSIASGPYPVAPLGIAMPGPFNYDQGISLITGLHKYESLYGLNVKNMLATALETEPGQIRFMNDAAAFLLGEYSFDKGLANENVLGLTLGTGLGSAACNRGKVQEVDLWRMPYGNSRAEDYLSSRWFIKEYASITGLAIESVKDLAKFAAEDEVARHLFRRFGSTLADVLIARYSCYDDFPSNIIIGGNIALAWQLFASHCQRALQNKGCSDVRLLPAKLGEDAALIGAAFLWKSL